METIEDKYDMIGTLTMRLFLYKSFIITTIMFSFPLWGEGATQPQENFDFVSLYKLGNYEQIIELSNRNNVSSEAEMILLGKAYEKLGDYARSNRVFKQLYKKRGSAFHLLSACFIASNLEKLSEYSGALKWYRHLLLTTDTSPQDVEDDLDSSIIVALSFDRLMKLAKENDKLFQNALKAIEKKAKTDPKAYYYLGLLYSKKGERKNACSSYLELILGKDPVYRKKALIEIPIDSQTLKISAEKGLGGTDLMSLFVAYGLYEKALITSYYLPYSADVARVRAVCFQGIGDYKTAALLFDDYYDLSNDPDALLRSAHLYYYYETEKELSLTYLERYFKQTTGRNIPDAEALFLKIQLERENRDIEDYSERVERFIRENTQYQKIDSIIYDAFYYIRQKKDIQSSLSFLSRIYRFLKKPLLRAWAFYLLGIYHDGTLLKDAIPELPGSYYYFQASKTASIEGETVKVADKLFVQGNYSEALNIYIRLYSKGVYKSYIREKISALLYMEDSFKPFYEIDKINPDANGAMLFKLYNLGLYDELKEMIGSILSMSSSRSNILLSYLLSKVHYETGNIYQGILYAERMVSRVDERLLLFLPKEILRLLYPFLYEDILIENSLNVSQVITPCLILSVIREESRFNSQAQSSKGALGLMQLMPSTANWISRKSFSRSDLLKPTENIRTGIQYLMYLFKQFDSTFLVLAAYNGGPGNVKKWLSDQRDKNSDQFIEEIPFDETRNFVKKVLTSYSIYRELYEDRCNESLVIQSPNQQ